MGQMLPIEQSAERAKRYADLWRSGMDAYVANLPRSDCPHEIESQEGVYWGWGWDEGARQDGRPTLCPYTSPALAIWWIELMAGFGEPPPRPFRQDLACPVLGTISDYRCGRNQHIPHKVIDAHPAVGALYRACRSGCPHSKLPKEY